MDVVYALANSLFDCLHIVSISMLIHIRNCARIAGVVYGWVMCVCLSYGCGAMSCHPHHGLFNMYKVHVYVHVRVYMRVCWILGRQYRV